MADPISLGGCTLWLDASDLSTITVAAGTSLVTQWNDKSGSAHNVTAATTARPTAFSRQLNGLHVLDFDGVANTMKTASFAQTQPWTMAAVVLSDNGANSAAEAWVSDVTNSFGMFKSTGNKWALSAGAELDSGAAVDAGVVHRIIGVANAPSTAVIAVDGAAEVVGNTGAGNTAGGLAIGSAQGTSGFWNGIIAEVVFYAGTMVAADRGRLQRYFSNKWTARSIPPQLRSVLLAPQTPQLLPTERFVRPAAPAALPTITGTLATTNANDTAAAAGTTTVTGTLAKTNANDTSTAAGTTTVTGALARTNANDTLSAAGSVGSPVSGTLATTNANDTSAAAGTTKILGTSATTNANDTLSATGTGNTNAVVTAPPAQQVGGTLSGRRGPYTAVDAELEAILRDDDEILVLL